jgi:hypothetical protein
LGINKCKTGHLTGSDMKKFFCLILITLFPHLAKGQAVVYKAGEKVNYAIHYGMLSGGIATLELKSEMLNGKEVLHSKIMAKTTGLADAVFRVLDIYEVYMDPETELPVKSIRNIREGRYRKYNEVLFDHDSRPDSAILTSDLTGIHITEKGIHDILSCFYYFRNNILPIDSNMRKGKVTTITTWFTDELYPVRLKYITTEIIKTKAGKIRCYKFNPVTEAGRLFKTEEDVSFWFSADKNFLPVKIRFDIFVGGFTVEMLNYEGLVYPLETVKK